MRKISSWMLVVGLMTPALALADVRVPGEPYRGPARREPVAEPGAGGPKPEARPPAAKPDQRPEQVRPAPAGDPATAPAAAPAEAAKPAEAAAVAAPAAVTPAFTEETRATAEKPEGFAYTILREAYIDDVRETYLYMKSSPAAGASVTVPIPKNRELLAQCITGGTVDDLVHGAIATVRYDPIGVVRPAIEIVKKQEVEIYDDARVLDRGGNRLYIRTADGREKGFNLDGGPTAWDEVIEGAKFADLVAGTTIRVEHDPGGRKPIRVVFKKKAAELDVKGNVVSKDKGCGCDTSGGSLNWGAAGFGALMLGLLASRRRVAVKR